MPAESDRLPVRCVPRSLRWIAGLLLLSGLTPVFAVSLSVSDTRCEYRVDPVGIDTSEPRLSWVIRSNARGVIQAAYQVLVASHPDRLKSDQGDLWDSGRVTSDQSTQIPYAGESLASGRTCYWKVRVWDTQGKRSPWSRPAAWTMGLLNEADWVADWIGFAPGPDAGDPVAAQLGRKSALEGCSWIWAGGAVAGDQPPGSVYFRKSLRIAENKTVQQALFLLTADDRFQLFVNGQPVGPAHGNWKALTTRDLTSALRPGENVIAIEATNTGRNPAGLLGRLIVAFSDGEVDTLDIDDSWLSARVVGNRWNAGDFEAGGWQSAAVIARNGDAPWGSVTREALGPAPYFRRAFRVAKPVERATLFASALGAYEVRLNGEPVDTDVLSPGWTDYRRRVHYLGYDVTSHLRRGENALGAILGDGWYASYLAFTGRRHYYGGDPRLLVQLQIDYHDGTREIICTDETWKAATGPIREADLLMGCTYDARREFPGWDQPGFEAASWSHARVDRTVDANLVAHPAEPIRRMEEIPAKSVQEPRPGVYVFDLGQNMVGWVRLKARGSAGQKIVVRHAEMLNPDGTLYTDNLRAAAATDTYVLAAGRKRYYEPHFTFHGFQYVEVTGLDSKPKASDVVGVVVHSDMERTGWFECSDPLVNRLVLNSLWGQKGNFLDVPTDCPQRDERAGWTGDAQVFMKTACLNMNAPAFYTKWLRDLIADSQRDDGAFCDVAPSLDVVGYGNTGWSDAGPICAWRMYEMYGDTRVLAEHYPALVRHMEYLAMTSTNGVRGAGAYGDWLRLAGPQRSEVIGTAYYAYTARVMADIAKALGRADDAARYDALVSRIRSAFVERFLRPDGRIADRNGETGQTFYALAFGLDLVPKPLREAVAGQCAASIAEQGGHIATGFLGTPFVLFALQAAGHPDLAYQLVLNTTYPSWLQQVLWGSTTMWERWDGWRPDAGFQDPGMNSFNHYWLGCVNEWLFTQVAGIDTEGPGFRRIIIRPEVVQPEHGLEWVNASYDSIRGRIGSHWKVHGKDLRLNIEIPANSKATVSIPASEPEAVTEGGDALSSAENVAVLGFENGRVIIGVGSGTYKFVSRGFNESL